MAVESDEDEDDGEDSQDQKVLWNEESSGSEESDIVYMTTTEL